MTIQIPDDLQRILAETPELNQAYLVGGSVRDALLGIPHKDFDLEVFGVSYEQLVTGLSRWGRTDLVGRSFGVIKLSVQGETAYDFTIPRRDSKHAPGHKGFAVQFDPGITLQEAASRRDFTINAIMYDPRQAQMLDFFGGLQDLERRILRHTSAAFVEDPLRVLRGMQFVSRFNLEPAPETVALCQRIHAAYHELALERVWDEWHKWAVKSVLPSAGLRFLEATGWLAHFPEIQALRGIPQDPEWHPEGDVFEHTCHACDALVNLPGWREADETDRAVYSFAVLAHDFAKPKTTATALKNGKMRIVSPGHESEGGPLAFQFLERIHAPLAIGDRVIPLVTHHLAAHHLSHMDTITDRSVRRLAQHLAPDNIHGLCVVITADHNGRPPLPTGIPKSVREIETRAAELLVQDRVPESILKGRHLLEMGFSPGKHFGTILEAAYEAQLDGEFHDLDQAREWTKKWLESHDPA